ncbi:MAG: tetratricopeptide repeat protein [Caldilineaceae bacterium]
MYRTHLDTFEQYIAAGLQEMLGRVQAAENLLEDEDRQQAWHLLSFALSVETLWNPTCTLLCALAPKMEQAGFRESWLVYLTEAHQQAEKLADRFALAEFELQIGLLYRLMSRFQDARVWTSASVDHFSALDFSDGERRALNELAWQEQLQHEYDSSTLHAQQALQLAQDDDLERGMSYRVLGMIANSRRKWQEAQAYHEQALAIFERKQDWRGIAWSLQNLALSLHEQAQLETAIAKYTQAAQLLKKEGDSYHWAIVQMNLGVALFRNGDPSASLLHYTHAATLFYRLSDTLNIAKIETNLGISYHSLGNYSAAEHAFSSAIDAYAKLGDLAWKLNASAGLGMTYIGAHRYQDAIVVLESALGEIDKINDHPYYKVVLNHLHQYLDEAKVGRANDPSYLHTTPV